MKFYIIYHGIDLDGWISALLIEYFINNNFKMINNEIIFIGMDHSNFKKMDIIEDNSIVYITDYTPPNDYFEKIVNKSKQVYWFDHHDSSFKRLLKPKTIEYLQNNKDIILSNYSEQNMFDWMSKVRYFVSYGYSGVGLTYKFLLLFFRENYKNNQMLSKLIYHISKYDIGSPGEIDNYVYFYLEQYYFDPITKLYSFWDIIENKKYNDIVTDGKKIFNYLSNKNNSNMLMKSTEFNYDINGNTYSCILCPGVRSSISFGKLFNEYDFCFASNIDNDGTISISVYSKKLDSTIISTSFGGGGHKGASGFKVKSYSIKDDNISFNI